MRRWRYRASYNSIQSVGIEEFGGLEIGTIFPHRNRRRRCHRVRAGHWSIEDSGAGQKAGNGRCASSDGCGFEVLATKLTITPHRKS